MQRCREIAGILFKHECSAAAVAECSTCRKPICGTHCRSLGQGAACIGCMRQVLQNPASRGSLAYLRDDPFFFWYYGGEEWLGDPYGVDDFALFDSNDGDFAQGAEPDWRGS